MPKITINGVETEVEDGLTVKQACESVGIEIPHFCYHDKLNIAGNCRMCLVEIKRSHKLIASCAMNVYENMIINTETEKVKKARSGVMEFLLINHPLDCPICDQGGECDLQDQAFKYGSGASRYTENKRAVKDKYMGPLIKTHMTRCIHCTRCIRFASDIAGVPEIGAIGRGEHMEVTSYLEKTLTSELSGNVIDLCPVGALTSKPYAFKARSWELKKTESVDVMDAVGSNIRIDSVGLEVMRILPKINDEINEDWISDKARFSYDGLKYQRLDQPYIRLKNGKLSATDWKEVNAVIVKKLKALQKAKSNAIASIAGSLCSVESMYVMKHLLHSLGSDFCDANQFNYKIDVSARNNYLFNTTISAIENADLCLLVGADVRSNAPIVNAKIGQMVRNSMMKVARIGELDDQTYKIIELGNSIDIINDIINEKSEFNKLLKKAKNPMMIIGDGVFSRSDGFSILSLLHQIIDKFNFIREDWNGFNILHNHASIVGALDVGFYYGKNGHGTEEILKRTHSGEVKILYILGADDFNPNLISEDCFVIYQGHHGDKLANRADIILPEAAYTEQDGIYVNLEGRPQYARQAVPTLGSAKESWRIIKDIADLAKIKLGFNDLGELRQKLAEEHAVFERIDHILPHIFKKFGSRLKPLNKPIKKIENNYYMTDQISRASVTMSKCLRERKELETTS